MKRSFILTIACLPCVTGHAVEELGVPLERASINNHQTEDIMGKVGVEQHKHVPTDMPTLLNEIHQVRRLRGTMEYLKREKVMPLAGATSQGQDIQTALDNLQRALDAAQF